MVGGKSARRLAEQTVDNQKKPVMALPGGRRTGSEQTLSSCLLHESNPLSDNGQTLFTRIETIENMRRTKTILQCVLIGSALALALKAQAAAISLDDLFTQWEPKKAGAADYHSFGALAPTNGPATVRAISFSTSQEFADLWRYYAAKCAIDRRFVEGNIYVLSGTNRLGSYFLVERSPNLKMRESLFGLRTESYSVFVTLRNSNEIESRPTAGTVVVSLH
jgi:hypothetical protein